jgi:hypothetical protein
MISDSGRLLLLYFFAICINLFADITHHLDCDTLLMDNGTADDPTINDQHLNRRCCTGHPCSSPKGSFQMVYVQVTSFSVKTFQVWHKKWGVKDCYLVQPFASLKCSLYPLLMSRPPFPRSFRRTAVCVTCRRSVPPLAPFPLY